MFDLPVGTPAERKAATDFRNSLLDLGFEMAQFSVYLRFCRGKEHSTTLSKRIGGCLPGGGKVDILFFTDKQYENILSFRANRRERRCNPAQFALF